MKSIPKNLPYLSQGTSLSYIRLDSNALLAIESVTAAIESAVGISAAEEAAIDSGAFVSDVRV